jgi:mRNA interferase MazF
MAEKIDKSKKPRKIRIVGEIRRGDVFQADWEDAEGYEQEGPRPVVVVSNNKQNEKKRVIVAVPLTRTLRPYPFQASTFFRGVRGKAKCEQVRAITIERFEEKRGSLTKKEMIAISDKLMLVLDLTNNISDEKVLAILAHRIRKGRIKWTDVFSLFTDDYEKK